MGATDRRCVGVCVGEKATAHRRPICQTKNMIGELKRRGGDKLESKTDMLCGQHRKLKFVP